MKKKPNKLSDYFKVIEKVTNESKHKFGFTKCCINCKHWEYIEYYENDRSPELKIGDCFQFDKWDTDNGFDFSEDKYSYVEYNGHMDGSSPLITSEKFYCNKYKEKENES